MSNFDERLKRGAASSALSGTTGAALDSATVTTVCALGGSVFGPVGTFFGAAIGAEVGAVVGGSIGTIAGFLGGFFED